MRGQRRRGRAYILLRIVNGVLDDRDKLLENAHLVPLGRRVLNRVPVEHFLKEPCLDIGPLKERCLRPSHMRGVQELEILRPECLQCLLLTWRRVHGGGSAVHSECCDGVQVLRFCGAATGAT